MVGYTPSLSTAVWVGTEQAQAITNMYGSAIYGSGLPSDIWKKTMDGALDGTDNEKFPWPEPVGGQAGVPSYSGQSSPSTSGSAPPPPPALLPPPPPLPRTLEILPGIVIPLPG